MKKTSLIMSMGLLVLASCSNDELVKPVVNPENGKASIGFNQRVGNMSRDASQLETVAADFGVWGIKGTDQATAIADLTDAKLEAGGGAENVIMNKYLVGYFNGNATTPAGYKPTHDQADYSAASGVNYWYYEGLGNNEDGAGNGYFIWNDFGTFTAAATSANAKQYLKYWDYSADYTYFYAYAPYAYTNAQLKLGDIDANGANEPYLEFPGMKGGKTTVAADGTVTITEGAFPNVMYASARVAKASYGNDVAINFQRLLSQIRLAFYETVPGYSVEMVALNNKTDQNAIVLVPTSADDNTKINAASKGYITEANAAVYFTEDTDLEAAVAYTGTPTVSTDNIVFGASQLSIDGGTAGSAIGVERSHCAMTPWLGVVPVNGTNTNDTFTLNVTLKFTSEDTGEVFYVYGARVLIPVGTVQWAPNKQYTYIFHISTGVSGDTGKPNPDPAGGSDPNDALKPIVFQDVTVENLTDVAYGDYDL